MNNPLPELSASRKRVFELEELPNYKGAIGWQGLQWRRGVVVWTMNKTDMIRKSEISTNSDAASYMDYATRKLDKPKNRD